MLDEKKVIMKRFTTWEMQFIEVAIICSEERHLLIEDIRLIWLSRLKNQQYIVNNEDQCNYYDSEFLISFVRVSLINNVWRR
jgi:hypothetical protein